MANVEKAHTVIRELNRSWNEVLEFNMEKPTEVFSDMLEVDVYHDKSYGPARRNNFLGRLQSSHFVKKGEEALIYYPLEKRSLLSWIQGEIGLKIYYVDAVPAPPVAPPEKDPPVPEGGKPDEKAGAPSSTEPSLPADEKPAEEPFEGAKAETEVAPQPPAPENAVPEGEKKPQPDSSAPPPPQEEQPPEAEDQEPPQNAREEDPPQPVKEQGDIEFNLSGSKPSWESVGPNFFASHQGRLFVSFIESRCTLMKPLGLVDSPQEPDISPGGRDKIHAYSDGCFNFRDIAESSWR
ncbi:hypothetical protein Pint_20091 [Pistacia integerrima]|uniref:Uncharacterized protein n=1 Tax=Pistacia integerrima TaxID=434235 RepID=A0ACC0XFW1_9ROSI|nr:hypothetical protein Pint_20091 [Pistacia integerrima]